MNQPEKSLAHSLNPPSYRIPKGLVCDTRDVSDRIIGGGSVIPHSWPWIMNLSFGHFSCGGTIIDGIFLFINQSS